MAFLGMPISRSWSRRNGWRYIAYIRRFWFRIGHGFNAVPGEFCAVGSSNIATQALTIFAIRPVGCPFVRGRPARGRLGASLGVVAGHLPAALASGGCSGFRPDGRAAGYDVASGTSMASPIVAAIAALACCSHSGATNTSARANVESTADPIFGTGTYWAYGRVNACRAVGRNCK